MSTRVRRLVILAYALVLPAAAALAVITRQEDRWPVPALLTIAVFVVVSDLKSLRPTARITITGSFLGIMLTAVSVGGAPAAAIGVLSIGTGWFRTRERPEALITNAATYAAFPLLSGLAFHAVMTGLGITPEMSAFYLLVFGAFLFALGLNFLGVFIFQCCSDGTTLMSKVHEFLMPLLPAELVSALLTAGGVYVYIHGGTTGLLLCALVFVVFQYLVSEMLVSKSRRVALHRAATTDELTGLANRERFRHVVDRRIAAARTSGSRFALLLMDLDSFKEINDALGHDDGDALLRDLGPRLAAAVGDEGLVARLGGDEFAIVLGDGSDEPAVLDTALGRLFEHITEPFRIDDMSLEVGASMGVARFPRDGEDAHALLRCADIAMYAAKEAQADYKIYTREQNPHSVRRLSVLSDIRHAISTDQIVVHFQPIVDLDDRTVRGAEGLVRWQHPEHGLIPPGSFVQIVEQTGLIGPLTRTVLEQSIAQCATWRREGRDLSVAVNLSVRNLMDRDLPQQVARLLDAHRLPAHALQLEITESMIMSDPDRAVTTVNRLSALGVRLSVDDFGTGHSSLANLRKLPIDELKIDRSFVSPMLADESDLIIVRSTINLGHDLGLRIIAEGVEDALTLERLAALGCDLAQGYHLSRPLPAPAFDRWLQEADVEFDAPLLSGPRLPVPLTSR